jgi:enoyl-CoA hydratase
MDRKRDDELLTDVRGRVLVITLNRPEVRNAVTTGMAGGILDAVARLDSSSELDVGVITGAGRGFCSGMDLRAMGSTGTPRGLRTFVRGRSRKPLIAAIEGFALAGGLEIALTCDLIVASCGAKLGLPETGVGIFAAAGGIFHLAARVPTGLVREMALTAEPITAERAAERGLVDRLVEPGAALHKALELAERISRNAPLGVGASKKLLDMLPGRTDSEFWTLESELAETVFRSRDAKEGARAFVEKRPPNWTGT